MLEIFLIISPLFLIILGSAILGWLKWLPGEWQPVLNGYALKVGFPALIFFALSTLEFSFAEHGPILLSNSLFALFGFFVAYLVSRLLGLSAEMRRTLFICIPFLNFAYLGIPVLMWSYGEHIAPEASLIVAVHLFWIFTVGIAYLDYSKGGWEKGSFKKILFGLLKNPLLLAVVFGLCFSALDLSLPMVFEEAISMLAKSVTPIVLMVIGLFFAYSPPGKLKEWFPSSILTIATLLVLPGVFYGALLALNLPMDVYGTSVVQAAMPVAITPFALADEYKMNKTFIARSIILSTVFSALSLPFWIGLVA